MQKAIYKVKVNIYQIISLVLINFPAFNRQLLYYHHVHIILCFHFLQLS